MTRVSATAVMKLVSPAPAGQDVHVEVAGDAGAGAAADVGAHVDALGPVSALESAHRVGHAGPHRCRLVGVEVLELAHVAIGSTSTWPLVYG